MTDEQLRGATLYIDCAAGIAGDMTVGALVDLGVPEAAIADALAALPVGGYRVEFARVVRGGMTGTKFRVLVDEEAHHGHAHAHEHDEAHAHDHDHGHEHPHVHYRDIRALLDGAPIADGIKRRALAIFDAIARVEAKIHGVSVEEVAFHEVGAVDSIVDIVGTAAALAWIGPRRIVSRTVALGGGTAWTAHGRLPVPTPATLELLVGAPVEDGGAQVELTTPTGAAILNACASGYGAMPAMSVVAVGWGAGDRELPDRPNLLRVVAGRETAAAAPEARDGCVVVEANVDDMNPELAPALVEALLAAGALDAWLAPVVMKKGRPALVVSALATGATLAAVETALLRESTTIGVRRHAVERTVLPRALVEVATPWGRVPVKVAGEPSSPTNVAPEYEACRALAESAGVPTKRVYAEAIAAFYRR